LPGAFRTLRLQFFPSFIVRNADVVDLRAWSAL
jgi:hypothetical protein